MGVSCITGFLQNVFGARVCLQEQAAIGINGLEFLMPSTAVTQGLQGRARPMNKSGFRKFGVPIEWNIVVPGMKGVLIWEASK